MKVAWVSSPTKKKKKSNIKEETGNGKGRDRKKSVNDVKEREVEVVMFVPYTKNAKLQKALQETDDKYVQGTKNKRKKFQNL